MDIATWLFKNKISKTTFARTLRISRTYLHEIIRNRYTPRKLIAERIEMHTGGAIKASTWKKEKRSRKPKMKQLDAFE